MLMCLWSKNDKITEVAQLLMYDMMLANGIDVNQTNNYGNNVLMAVCLNSESDKIVEVAQLLILEVCGKI